MRKSLVVIIILVIAALLATLWVNVEDFILEKTHPLPYYETVQKYAAEYAVPEEIVYAVMNTESSFKSDAVSNKGAIGLMQITPDTFEWLCTKTPEEEQSTSEDLLYNPEINIKYGTFFLSLLYTEFGVWDTVYAAYNAGMNRVSGWLQEPEHNLNGKIVNIPFPETEKYVEKVSKAAIVYKKLYFGEQEKD